MTDDKRDSDPDGPDTIKPPALDASKPRDEHVLVVDDDVCIQETLAEILSGEGYRVRVAGDGISALAKILKDKPAPDVVLLDLSLPWLSGRGVKAALDAEDNDTPVVIISAGDMHKLMKQNPELQRDFVFIAKPLDLETLLRTVRERISEHRQRVRKLPF